MMGTVRGIILAYIVPYSLANDSDGFVAHASQNSIDQHTLWGVCSTLLWPTYKKIDKKKWLIKSPPTQDTVIMDR